MQKRILIVLLGVVACGDNDERVDAGMRDASVDAGADAFACPTFGSAPSCGTTAAPTVAATSNAVCNPLTQTGCATGEKCAWINDGGNGRTGCTPAGTIAVGCACSTGVAGTTGYDDCVGGSQCVGGTCRAICDHLGGAPMCGTGFSCGTFSDVFVSGATNTAGVCNTSCDPLTQCSSAGATTNACGSSDGATPSRGCYGDEDFICSSARPEVLTKTDRQIPRMSTGGTPFINGCAPGFTPMFFESTGSMQVLCAGFCAALEIDNTPAHMNNGKGDPDAVAKLPNQPLPLAGNATCDAGKKGSEASSTCMFYWAYILDTQGMVPAEFRNSGLLDTLGVCFAYSHFRYDADNNPATGVDGKEAPYPDCATLPPRSAATPGATDDAFDWGCQKLSSGGATAQRPVLRQDVNVRPFDQRPMYRHEFR